MTREGLVEIIRQGTGCLKKEAESTLEVLLSRISQDMIYDHPLELRGFGTLKMVKRAPKKGFDISRGVVVDIPARIDFKFKPSKALLNEAMFVVGEDNE